MAAKTLTPLSLVGCIPSTETPIADFAQEKLRSGTSDYKLLITRRQYLGPATTDMLLRTATCFFHSFFSLVPFHFSKGDIAKKKMGEQHTVGPSPSYRRVLSLIQGRFNVTHGAPDGPFWDHSRSIVRGLSQADDKMAISSWTHTGEGKLCQSLDTRSDGQGRTGLSDPTHCGL